MFFTRPYKKAILAEIKKKPLFAERWFYITKHKEKLVFDYHDFETRLTSITGGSARIIYKKDGTLIGELFFSFLEDDPRFSHLTDVLDAVADDGIDDISVFAERKHKPAPRSVVVSTIEGVTKQNIRDSAYRLLDTMTAIVEDYASDGDEDEEEYEEE
ncbi:MAG: hypothetical protein E7609_04180 [Ruminococcaceae bacterium]|nr:hypothetical protein [Oscillospiraceae bacterium]